MTIHSPIIGRLAGRLPALVVSRDRAIPYAERTEIVGFAAGTMRLTENQAYWWERLRVARYRDVNCRPRASCLSNVSAV